MFMVHILFSPLYLMYTQGCIDTVKNIHTGSCPVQPEPSTVGCSASSLAQLCGVSATLEVKLTVGTFSLGILPPAPKTQTYPINWT